MRILLAIGLNIGLLVALVAWVRHQRRTPELGRWLLPLLGLKLLVSLRDVLLLSEDARLFQSWAAVMTRQLWTAPGSWLRTLFTDELHFEGQKLIFHGYSNTFFIIKLLSGLNLASLGAAGLNSVYLSLFCFVGCWQLVRVLARLFPDAPRGAAVVAFLGWPTVLYWTAGLNKETLLLGSAAWVLALVLPWLYGGERPRPTTVLGAVLLAVLHFKMRFFFAIMLFAALGALAAVRLVQRLGGARRRWVQVLLVAALVAAGGAAIGEVSPVFRLNKFTSQLVRSYSELLEDSRQQPHIEYANLAPTLPSVLRNAPVAVLHVMTRPWPWEEPNGLYLVAGLENVALLLVLAGALVAVGRGRAGGLPFALVLVLLTYSIVLAALIGLSTPNLGTLNRYRAVVLPFVLLLALQNDYAARALRRLGL